MLALDEYLQIGQAVLPERAVTAEPRIDGAQRDGIQFVNPVAAQTMFTDQASAAKQTKMLRDGGTGDRKGPRDSAGGQPLLPQQVKDCAARRVGEGAERCVC